MKKKLYNIEKKKLGSDFIKHFFKKITIFSICLVLCAGMSINSAASASSSIAKEEVEINTAARAEVFEASIERLNELLEGGAITSKEICQVYIERIEKLDKSGAKLNAVISINTNAIAKAEQLDAERAAGNVRGKLHGIPILVKDNIDVSGFPTTLGKEKTEQNVVDQDAVAVEKLVEQGAIILGKTNLSTNDLSTRYTVSSLLGETRNAYNTKYSSGGSSGGSAVAVSANYAAAALGTDTNFSLLYPAALNGVVAVRPTHSLIDYTGAAKVNSSRDVIGPITKSVADAALMMDILTDNTHNNKYSSALKSASLKGKKLLVLKELSQYTYNSPNEFRDADKEILELFNKAKDDLKTQGAEIIDVSIPKLFTYYNTCRESHASSDTAKANLLAEAKKLLEDNDADAFIFPAYLSTPLKSGFNEYGEHNADSQTYLNCTGYFPSLIGLPAVCVPMGTHSSGISTGIEFVSLKNTEEQLLSLAYSYEQATQNRKVPKIAENFYEKGEIVLNKPSIEPEFDPQENNNPTKPQKDHFPWQTVAVAIIIIAVLTICSWVLIAGSRSRKNSNSKYRHRRF